MVLRALLTHVLLLGLDSLRENYTSDHTGFLGTTLLFSSDISDFRKLEHSSIQVHVAQEHSRANVSGDFIVQVPSLFIGNVPINTPPALLLEFLVDLILKRSHPRS